MMELLGRSLEPWQTTTRKSMIGKSEIEWTCFYCNHIEGCQHNCPYCYARMLKRKTRAEWPRARLVVNTLDLLDKELPKHPKTPDGEITICTTTDPFQSWEATQLTLAVIAKFIEYGVYFRVLTKNKLVQQALPLFEEAKDKCWVGMTVTTVDEEIRQHLEPGASSVQERIYSLAKLWARGIKTFCSLEPMPKGSDPLKVIATVSPVVREIFVGKMSYCKNLQPSDEWVRLQVARINSFFRKWTTKARLIYKKEIRALFPSDKACYQAKTSSELAGTLDAYFEG